MDDLIKRLTEVAVSCSFVTKWYFFSYSQLFSYHYVSIIQISEKISQIASNFRFFCLKSYNKKFGNENFQRSLFGRGSPKINLLLKDRKELSSQQIWLSNMKCNNLIIFTMILCWECILTFIIILILWVFVNCTLSLDFISNIDENQCKCPRWNVPL